MSMTPGGAASERTFRQSLTRRILSFLFLSVIVILIAFFVVFRMLPNTMTQATRFTIIIAGILVVMALMAWTMLIAGNQRVVVSPTTVDVRRPGKVVHSWPRQSTYFTTHVLKQTTNGIPSGTVRSLVAHTPQGETKVALGAMSRSTFNEMYALINTDPAAQTPTPTGYPGAPGSASVVAGDVLAPPLVSAPPAPSEAARAASAMHPRTYVVNAALVAKRARGMWAVTGVIGAVFLICIVLAVMGDEDFAAIGWVLGSIAFVMAILFAVISLTLQRRASTVPSAVTVDGVGLTIDGQVYPFAGMSRAWLSPPSYTSRHMKLVGQGGATRRFDFGQAGTDPAKTVFVAWPDFVSTMQEAGAAYPGVVALDLE